MIKWKEGAVEVPLPGANAWTGATKVEISVDWI